jgi:fused signal recognition particle receptor
MDPSSYAALLAFNAISSHFARRSQRQTATEEGDRQRTFQQQQFEAQREEQRRQAKERREQEWALATRQRETALELQENQKVLDHWPLRLFPSQILQSHRCDGPTPLRVFLSLPANGPRDLEGPVRQALQQFLSTHYNFNLGVRPIELLDGAWKDGQFQGAASIKALHERLRSEPTLVLETQTPEGDDHLYINLAYWGPAQDQYLYQTLEKIAYRPVVEDCARAAARQWRQARERLIEQGLAKDNLDADQRFGGVRAANLKRLEQEEALSAAGIALDQVDPPPFQLVKEDWRAIHQFLITWHCLVMGWIGDLYHFSYWETPPLLPKLLPDLLHPDFPAAVAHAFIDHYCRSYRAVAAERPAWGPELALQLATPLAALPDPVWATGQVGQAIQDWLALRGFPPVVGTGVAVIDSFCTQVGAADGPVGPALLLDPDFLAGLCDAIGYLHPSALLEKLVAAANVAEKRCHRQQLKGERQQQLDRSRCQFGNGLGTQLPGHNMIYEDLPVELETLLLTVAVIENFCTQFGAANGRTGPALFADLDFLVRLRDAIGRLHRPEPVGQLELTGNSAVERQQRKPPEEERRKRVQQQRLALSRAQLGGNDGLIHSFLGSESIGDDLLDELETLLLTADLGVDMSARIVGGLTRRVKHISLTNPRALFTALREELRLILTETEMPLRQAAPCGPLVFLMVGDSGAGKTTTIGKLARVLRAEGNSVMLAAGDTLRAAAAEQLRTWGALNRVPVFAERRGADAASVMFDALQAATARGIDILIADTAGWLHNKPNLMDELSKIARAMKKIDPKAPHEVLLVVDATTSQCGLDQAIQFHQAVPLTGIVLTKLDGTANGGIVFAIAERLRVPIRFLGVGESIEDLLPFDPDQFLDILLSE